MLYVWLIVGCIFCAVQALRATGLLTAALWLAGVSALLATFLYAIGGHEIAVIELSVGTGLVTVLLVFAISITGDGATDARARLPRPLAWALIILASLLLGWMTMPWIAIHAVTVEYPFARVLWQGRSLDVLVQIVLMFIGALGVVGLLADARPPTQAPAARANESEPLERNDERRPEGTPTNDGECVYPSSVPPPSSFVEEHSTHALEGAPEEVEV